MAYVSQEFKREVAPQIRAVLKKYGMRGTVSVRNHSTLAVTLTEGAIDFPRPYMQVNHYWIDEHYEGTARDFLTELLAAMRGPNYYDHSDIQTDYFCVSHYTDIDVGRYNRPYRCTAREALAQ